MSGLSGAATESDQGRIRQFISRFRPGHGPRMALPDQDRLSCPRHTAPRHAVPRRDRRGGAGVGGGGPRLTRLRGQQVRYSNLSACSPTSYQSRRTNVDMGAILARQISAQLAHPDLRVLLLCAAVHRMQHRGVPRPMSAWSAQFGHCPNTSPSPAILGRQVAQAAVASSSSRSSSSRRWKAPTGPVCRPGLDGSWQAGG